MHEGFRLAKPFPANPALAVSGDLRTEFKFAAVVRPRAIYSQHPSEAGPPGCG